MKTEYNTIFNKKILFANQKKKNKINKKPNSLIIPIKMKIYIQIINC